MANKKITSDELRTALEAEFQELIDDVTEAVNAAQPGRIIADSEEPVRDANAVFRQRLYQKAMDLLQQKQEAFSPSEDNAVEEQGPTEEHPSDG
jgi:hypothetical protein